MLLSDFENDCVKPLLTGLQHPFPVSCVEEDGLFIARIFPDYNYFGKLGLHFEGAVWTNSKKQTEITASLVVYIQNKPGYTELFGLCVICGTFDTQQQTWSDWRILFDEFKEYLEPLHASKFPDQFNSVASNSTMLQLLASGFDCEFTTLIENKTWKAVLAPIINLELIVSCEKDNLAQLTAEMKILGKNAFFSWENFTSIKYDITDSNELLFNRFE